MTMVLFSIRRLACRAMFALLSVGLLTLPAAVMAQKGNEDRVALVIGNSDYAFSPLVNPKNDAVGMADLLTQAGFQVSRTLNAGRTDLKAAVEQFGKRLRAPGVKFAIFYYAGHGVQLDWRNYLIPVDAKVRSADDVRAQAVDVSELLRFMDEAKDKSFLVILDACRDDPFGGSYKASNKGLSQFDGPVGSLLAYSTSPGNVAMDGSGDNGLYTSHLLRELAVRNTKLEDAFKRVRLNVRLESGGRQIPWESTSLEEDIYLFKSDAKKLSESEQEAMIDKELAAWKRVKTSTDTRVLANFIREFPSGSTSELAQSRLNRILVSLSTVKGQGDAANAVTDKSGKSAAALSAQAAQAAAQQAEQAKQVEKAEKAAREAQARAEELRLADEKAQQLKATEEANRQAEARRQEAFRLAAQAQLKLMQEAKARDQQKQEELRLARQREEAQQAMAVAAAAKLEAERQAALQAQKVEAARLAAEREANAARQAQAEELRRQEAMAQELARQEAVRQARIKEEERLALAAAEAARVERERIQLFEAQVAEANRLAAEREAAAARSAAAEAERRQEFNRLAIAQAAQAQQAQERLLALQAEADRAREAAAQEMQRVARLKEEADKAARMAAVAADVQIAAAAPVAMPAMALAPTPFYVGSNVFMRQYSVGDEFGFRVIDGFNKTEKPLVLAVSAVDVNGDRVEYNGGEYTSDLMGNITRNVRGSLDSPRQFYPAELFVGKRWKTQFKQTRANGTVYTFKYDLKVVGKETVTVPAGTFETYKVEARGFNVELGANLQRNIWIAPGINADIAHETLVRLRNGQIDQNERQELVRYVSSSRVAVSAAQ